MKILITGAHFTPAVATIESLKKFSNTEIVYVGRNKTLEGDSTLSVESQVLPSLGVKFLPIITGRLQREFSRYTIYSLLKIPIGFFQSFYILLTERPDVILSFGGYVAVPIVIVGWLFSIPIIIHEQTLVSGLASQISSIFADKIALSFNNDNHDPKYILTGNPIRKMFSQAVNLLSEYKDVFAKARKNNLPVILITAGNQGSHAINLAIEQVLEKLTKVAVVIHITGDNQLGDFERLEKKGNNNDRYLVKKWIDEEYAAILERVDLVICRAGINTLTELALLEKPAIVIPLPNLYNDEQNKNAKYFEKLDLVKIIPQSQLSQNKFFDNIKFMIVNLKKTTERAKKAKQVILPGGAKRLALETMLLINKV